MKQLGGLSREILGSELFARVGSHLPAAPRRACNQKLSRESSKPVKLGTQLDGINSPTIGY